MKVKTVYLDDDDSELKMYTRRFSRNKAIKDRFEICPINVQQQIKDLITNIRGENPDLILVDLDLTIPKNDVILGISGAPLSTILRESFPEIPIVLFTKEDMFFKINPQPQLLSCVNKIIYKNKVFDDVDATFDILYNLSIGFKVLQKTETKKWDNLFKLIDADEIDYDFLDLSIPPDNHDTEWTVVSASNWLQNVLIKYPGILYDAVHSATFLGISKNAFLSFQVQDFFKAAKYVGFFAPYEGCWWKTKLQEVARSIMNESEKDLLTREGFSKAWDRINSTQIERSKCTVSRESPADCVCYILKEPIMIKNSLSYRPDSRPSVMDEARVSFKAIRSSSAVIDELFGPLETELLPKIRD